MYINVMNSVISLKNASTNKNVCTLFKKMNATPDHQSATIIKFSDISVSC